MSGCGETPEPVDDERQRHALAKNLLKLWPVEEEWLFPSEEGTNDEHPAGAVG